MLPHYHKLLWSRTLPNGEHMDLQLDNKGNLFWKRSEQEPIYFGSDSITTSFRYKRMQPFFSQIREQIPNLEAVLTDFLHKAYTIGGLIIFPGGRDSINRARGINRKICDRWDLTLECIRLYYDGIIDKKDNPLGDCLERNSEFFDLFTDFRGYTDFFFLQDCVADDYKSVCSWLDTKRFVDNPLPENADAYLDWLRGQLMFVEERNKRIEDYSVDNFNKVLEETAI